MAAKAKHAFGSLEQIDSALSNGKIDSYDILFVKDANGKPYVGWIDKDGKKVVVDDSAELAELEGQIANKASAEEVAKLETQVDEKLATKATTESVTALGTQITAELATKANTEEVDTKINNAVTDTVASAKAYTDGKIEAAISEHMVKKFEITSVPEGALVDYREKEIRIMCPANTQWSKQAVGSGGDANCYYATFKTYVFDDNVVGYIEHLGDQVDKEVLTTFSTDEYGRRYQVTWLALAKYDDATGTWAYYGKNSSVSKYIGWDYQIDWYNANGVVVASDNVRINLSNEQCHSSIEPYYIGDIIKEVDTKIEERIAEVESSYEIVEF